MPPPTSKPSATGNATEAARGAVAAINVALPATVVSYDRTTQKAVIRIVPCRRKRGAGGVDEVYRAPDLPGVPVLFPGGGEISITWPLSAGDSGLAVFSDRSMDEWLSQGGVESEPQDPRRFDVTDAVFLPGLRSFAEAVPGAGVHETAMVVRAEDLRLGSASASGFVALAALVEAELQAIWTAIQAHTHTGVTTGGGVSGVSGYPGAPGSVAATKVRAE